MGGVRRTIKGSLIRRPFGQSTILRALISCHVRTPQQQIVIYNTLFISLGIDKGSRDTAEKPIPSTFFSFVPKSGKLMSCSIVAPRGAFTFIASFKLYLFRRNVPISVPIDNEILFATRYRKGSTFYESSRSIALLGI